MRHIQLFTGVGALLTGLWMLCLVPGAAVAAGVQTADSDEQVSAEDIVRLNPRAPHLRSSAALVMDEREGVVLYSHNMHEQHPIASVTKLMTAMVTLERHLPMDQIITITPDGEKPTESAHSAAARSNEHTGCQRNPADV